MGEISSYFPSALPYSTIIGISEAAHPDLSVEVKCLCVQHKYIENIDFHCIHFCVRMCAQYVMEMCD